MRVPSLPALASACLLWNACLPGPGPRPLTAVSEQPASAMDCSSCHAYPLADPNHVYHMVYSKLRVKQVNGLVTCLDCHARSIRSTTSILYDSIYVDSQGVERSSLDFPYAHGPDWGTLARVDTLVQHHPIPSGRDIAADGELQEWATGPAHLNGKVDVDFDSAVNDLARFNGARAEFNPKLETCSAIRCHGNDGPYRFWACGKGLPGLQGDTVNINPCAGPH